MLARRRWIEPVAPCFEQFDDAFDGMCVQFSMQPWLRIVLRQFVRRATMLMPGSHRFVVVGGRIGIIERPHQIQTLTGFHGYNLLETGSKKE
jgi:hypothetical protein